MTTFTVEPCRACGTHKGPVSPYGVRGWTMRCACVGKPDLVRVDPMGAIASHNSRERAADGKV